MRDEKALYQSRTFWGGMVALVCAVLAIAGVDVDEGTRAEMLECGMLIGSALGGVLAVYGRIHASKAVRVPRVRRAPRGGREGAEAAPGEEAKTPGEEQDKPGKASGARRGLPLVLLAVALPLCLQACAMRDLTPAQKALAVGEELRIAYVALYEEYGALQASLPPEDVAYLEREVAPRMDAAKRLLVAYRSGAVALQDGESAASRTEHAARAEDVRLALAECAMMLATAQSNDAGGE
ncbi:hypothetical protein JCM16814_17140 [Desulfobaculum senezii]